MSTIKANNYEASTAGNNLIFKTNNAERMRIDTSGNLTLSSGNLTLSSGNLTLSSGNLTLSSGSLSGTVQRGSYGSLSVGSSTNTYSGIDFTAANATFMIRTSDRLSGVYKDNNTWAYYIDGSGNYYSGGGSCPQTTATPTLAEHLTRKDYVDTAAIKWYQNGTTAQRNAPPVGAIILADAKSLGTQSTTMQVSNNAGNLYYFSTTSATQVALVPGTWLAVGNNNGAGLWYRIA
jgi:hypothetical protein